MRWLSINEVERLIKQKIYWLETGSKDTDSLVYDKKTRSYVGHIESGQFYQNKNYEPTPNIIKSLDSLDENEWFKDSNW